jgi:hypothetical protein
MLNLSGPPHGGYNKTTSIYGVSGALPTENGFVKGRVGVQGLMDTLTFGPASAVGSIIVTLPNGTLLPVVIASAPKTAVQVASLFQSALPADLELISQIGNAVTFAAPGQSGQPSRAANGVSGALPTETAFTDGIPITHAKDSLKFGPATAAGQINITLPDKTQVQVVIPSAPQTAVQVASLFQSALPTNWTCTISPGGLVNLTGPTQSGCNKTVFADGVIGPLPTETAFTDGITITPAKDSLRFGPATAAGTIIVTLPDKTPLHVVIPSAPQTADQVALLFKTALPTNWTSTNPTGGLVDFTGPTHSGCSKTNSTDGIIGPLPTEAGFVDGKDDRLVNDTLTFGAASAAGTIVVTLPDNVQISVVTTAGETADAVAATFRVNLQNLTSNWTETVLTGGILAITGPNQSGYQKSIAVDGNSSITISNTDTQGVPRNADSLPSWYGNTTGYITTWADLETVLKSDKNTTATFSADPLAANPLDVYFRTDSSDTQDAFSTKALNTTASGKIGGTLSLTNSVAIGKYGNTELISACLGDPDGIGFGSTGSLISNPDIGVFNWNGVTPTSQHIIDSVDDYGKIQYSLWIPLILVTNGKPTGDVATFINWITVPSNNLALTQAIGFTSLYESR